MGRYEVEGIEERWEEGMYGVAEVPEAWEEDDCWLSRWRDKGSGEDEGLNGLANGLRPGELERTGPKRETRPGALIGGKSWVLSGVGRRTSRPSPRGSCSGGLTFEARLEGIPLRRLGLWGRGAASSKD